MVVCAVENVESGMILESDVRDQSGRVLLGAGMEITDKSAKILKSWGVVSVEIVGERTSGLSEAKERILSESECAKVRSELEVLFSHHDKEEPVTQELFQQCLDFRLRSLERAKY